MMSLEDWISTGVVGTLLTYLGFHARKVSNKVDMCTTYNQLQEHTDAKLAPMYVQHAELKEDIQRIESKLDRLIERQF